MLFLRVFIFYFSGIVFFKIVDTIKTNLHNFTALKLMSI